MSAIGVFDSGYGGLTILKELMAKLPQYDFIYYGDNQRAPYGERSFEEVYEFTLEATKKLFDFGCPLVILACNTASAKALRTIQQRYLPVNEPSKRVLGVIRPSAEVVGQRSQSHHIGLLATEGTVRSNSYKLELERFSPHIHLHQRACPKWVPLIEEDLVYTSLGKRQIQADVDALLALSPAIDTILLACTHYPIIEDIIRSLVPEHIQLVSQGKIVALSLVDYLERHPEINEKIAKNASITYYTSGDRALFDRQAKKFMNLDTKAKFL